MIKRFKSYDLITLLKVFFVTSLVKLSFNKKVRSAKGYPLILNASSISVEGALTLGCYNRIEVIGNGSISLGENVKLNDFVHIGSASNLVIGDNVLIGSRVTIVDHEHGNYSGSVQSSPGSVPDERDLSFKPIVINDNCWLGEGVVILKGVTLPAGTIVGANSVVTKSPSRACILGGIPARILKVYDDESGSWIKK